MKTKLVKKDGDDAIARTYSERFPKENKMKTEFTYEEVQTYIKNLTPGEKALIDLGVLGALEFILDNHFEEFQYETISLIELISFTAEAYEEHQKIIKGEE